MTPGALFGLAAAWALAQASPTSLSLDEAQAFALRNSPTIRSARAMAEVAGAEVRMARARSLPQLSAAGFGSTGVMSNVLQAPAEADPQALVLAPSGRFVDGNLMLMAPLYTGGLLAGLTAAAQANERAAKADTLAMIADVELAVSRLYAMAQYASELVKAQEARLAASRAMLQNAQALLATGKGLEAGVRRAEAEVADAQRELTSSQNERRKTILDLLSEMGAPLDREVVLQDALDFVPPRESLEENIRRAFERRGEVLAARERTLAARSQAKSAAAATGPQLYGFAMADAFDPRDMSGRRSGYTVGLTVSVPVFDGGMRRAQISSARAAAERAAAEESRIRLQAEREVRQAWLDIETAAQNYHTAQSAKAAAEASLEVVTLRVGVGKALLVEQLDAIAAVTRARANLAQALYEHTVAIAALERASGGRRPVPAGGRN